MKFKNDIKFVDPHVHLWALDLGFHHWLESNQNILLGDVTAITSNYLAKNYLVDTRCIEIEKIIHIESASSKFSVNEVEWLEHYAPNILGGIVAGIDFLDKKAEEKMMLYSAKPIVKGVRQILNWCSNPLYTSAQRKDDLENPKWQKYFSLLAKHNLSFDMQICPEQISAASQLANKFPNVTIIINHSGMPIAEYYDTWKKNVNQLAQYPNVFIKLSGFNMLYPPNNVATIKSVISYLLEIFGLDRCMFASNFPVEKLYTKFDILLSSYIDSVKGLSLHEQEKLFNTNARLIYKI